MMSKATHDLVKKVIKHSDVYGFFKQVEKDGIFNHYEFGAAGELLREAIKKEWIFSNVTHRESNVFMFNSGKGPDVISEIKDAFLWVKNFSNSELPFGLANTRVQSVYNSGDSELFKPQEFQVLKYYAFIGPHEAEQFFYRYQQQRKRWWRKFSLDPGKFSLAEVKKHDDSSGLVASIIAEFPWGCHTLETVYYFGSKPFDDLDPSDSNIFYVRSLKKRCLPHVVMCEVNLDYAVVSYVCDAFNTKKGRVILKFHRKLAPFKFNFAANPGTDEENKSLFEVSELICLQLRKAGLSALLPVKGEFGKKKLELQLLRSDSLGIPYTAVLSTETLNSGIFGLYSRETTLQEQVHISKMAEYGPLLMKNY